MIFRSNPGFIFHDSRGFESGSVEELDLMKKFLADRTHETRLERRLHAIWWVESVYISQKGESIIEEFRFCIPMTDYERPILAAEEKFFDECNTGNGVLL